MMEYYATIFQVLVTVFLVINGTSGTNSTNTDDDTEEFLQSNMFLGLAIGGGTCLGVITCLCVIWNCCCGRQDDDDDSDSENEKPSSPSRMKKKHKITPIIVV